MTWLMTDWEYTQCENGWEMPAAVWWKRLPIIRHLRACYAAIQVARRIHFYLLIGFIPTGYDEWVCAGIWHGKECDE